ncbi:MAG: hypothetical protein ACE37H_12020 [Phycisphaeraceae bacterium]
MPGSLGKQVYKAGATIPMVDSFLKAGCTTQGMNQSERTYLEAVYKDCIEQEREGVLSVYGAGQGDLCIELLDKGREPFRPGTHPND